MATDAQSLMTQASCYSCFGNSMYFLTLMRLALWRQYLLQLNPGATVDPQGLLDLARCYECFGSNKYALQLMRIAMLKQMATGISPTPLPPPTPTNFSGVSGGFDETFSWTQAVNPGLDFLLSYAFNSGGPYLNSFSAPANQRTITIGGFWGGSFWIIKARDSLTSVSAPSAEISV